MFYVEQFEKAVTEAGAVAIRIMRGPRGTERLIIQTPGGLITREVPLRGDLSKDIQFATTSAKEIVASAKNLTSAPARNLRTARGPRRTSQPPTALAPDGALSARRQSPPARRPHRSI